MKNRTLSTRDVAKIKTNQGGLHKEVADVARYPHEEMGNTKRDLC
jgi:hypothetical protein